jgi:glycosyltransferase involved in cell wall biosynthesis
LQTTSHASDESAIQTGAPAETIAFLLDYAPQNWCSREDYHAGLCQELSARGLRSLLVFAKEIPLDVATIFREKGIEYFTIDYSKGFSHYHRELGKLIREHSITAVHICYFDYFSAIAWMARIHGVKTIIYEAVNSGAFTARSWKKFLLQLRTAVMTRPLTRVIAISDFVKLQLIASGIPAEKIDVRYLGIDHDRFVPDTEAARRLRSQFAIDSDEVILTTVSFLNPFKNPHVIIKACGLMARQKIPFRLFVAGDGPLRQELELLSRTLDIADRVHWLGHVADPRELLQGSDIFTLASTGEAFGLVLTEAMACGLPVVATRSGGIVEIVEDQVTGLLVPPHNHEALAGAFKQLIQNPELKRTMGEKGRSRAAEMFTIDVVVANTLRIYESMSLMSQSQVQ